MVLLAEDVEELRSTLALILSREGFTVVEAADGRQAVERALDVQPDLIAMDLSLPVLDGAAAIRVLRTYASTRDIPVVALSGMWVSPSEAQVLRLAAVVRKPCTPNDLVAHLRAVLGPKRALRAGR